MIISNLADCCVHLFIYGMKRILHCWYSGTVYGPEGLPPPSNVYLIVVCLMLLSGAQVITVIKVKGKAILVAGHEGP
jgi:hypothetical protein